MNKTLLPVCTHYTLTKEQYRHVILYKELISEQLDGSYFADSPAGPHLADELLFQHVKRKCACQNVFGKFRCDQVKLWYLVRFGVEMPLHRLYWLNSNCRIIHLLFLTVCIHYTNQMSNKNTLKTNLLFLTGFYCRVPALWLCPRWTVVAVMTEKACLNQPHV